MLLQDLHWLRPRGRSVFQPELVRGSSTVAGAPDFAVRVCSAGEQEGSRTLVGASPSLHMLVCARISRVTRPRGFPLDRLIPLACSNTTHSSLKALPQLPHAAGPHHLRVEGEKDNSQGRNQCKACNHTASRHPWHWSIPARWHSQPSQLGLRRRHPVHAWPTTSLAAPPQFLAALGPLLNVTWRVAAAGCWPHLLTPSQAICLFYTHPSKHWPATCGPSVGSN